MTKPKLTADEERQLFFRVLGRTLEHFGVQMYKRREVAIAELVANCWDAGAIEVVLDLPNPDAYDKRTSVITIRDTGCGMKFDEVQGNYLVLGRNRRQHGGAEVSTVLTLFDEVPEKSEAPAPAKQSKRRVMGRKGIGKLAGFGLAENMTVATWRDGEGLEFYMKLKELKKHDNETENVPIAWKSVPANSVSPSGTTITLDTLKHKTPIDPDALRRSLARRFSRTVRGEMSVLVNGVELPDPTPPLDKRFPATNSEKDLLEHRLPSGSVVRYWYGFASDVIRERELRGFSILVNGKVAQAPPYFFDVEATASGQHSTRYVIGEIEVDFLDVGTNDEDDLVSTDRQELDWEVESVQELKAWGESLCRKVLAECRDFRGEKTVKKVLESPDLNGRIKKLDNPSQKQINQFLRTLGNRDDDGKTIELAGALVRAYEFRQFHDVIDELEKVAEDPEQLAKLLGQMDEWRVLESRALLEVIKGRLDIMDKFQGMLVNNAPETASSKSPENMHDLLAGSPWLLNPEWQVLAEEKGLTTQLREWGKKDLADVYDGRYDFLAIGDDGDLVIIEIKRPDYAANLDDLQRLEKYANQLSIAGERHIRMVFIGGREVSVTEYVKRGYDENPNFEFRLWSSLFDTTRERYEHYRAVLEGTVEHRDFDAKAREVARTRQILERGVYRGKAGRAEGIPPQDTDRDPTAPA